ncbi:MAG: hypothetical protein CL681_02995 [Blastopirellula sp.]|nr:hypothetical protein [Blastopirellula sp.]
MRSCVLLLIASTTFAAEPQRLTDDGRIKWTPVFLNNKELVYVDLEKPELTVIKRLNLTDLSTKRLHPEANTQELEPAFFKGGERSTYLKTTGGLNVGIVIRDEQKNKEALLPAEAGFCGYKSPAFFPDGNRVIFSFAQGGQQDLYSVNLDAKDRKQITSHSGNNYWPSFSPDGKRILFGSTRDGNYEIYSMNLDGKEVRRLTDCRFQDLRPQFSPDGKRIAFTSSRDGNFEVYVMNADGRHVKRITHHEERDDYAAWHPDGKRLVVISERDGSHDLYLVRVDD